MNKKLKKIKINEFNAFYINMDSNISNNINIQKVLKEDCGFLNITRVPGVESESKELGTTLAHLKALMQSQAPCVIFEDDCNVLNYINEIEIPEDADAIYLGHMPWGRVSGSSVFNGIKYEKVENSNDIYQVYNMLGAHAIIYLSELYFNAAKASCISSANKKIIQDIAYAEMHNNFNIYAIGMPMFYQHGHYEKQTNKHILEYKHYSYNHSTNNIQ